MIVKFNLKFFTHVSDKKSHILVIVHPLLINTFRKAFFFFDNVIAFDSLIWHLIIIINTAAQRLHWILIECIITHVFSVRI